MKWLVSHATTLLVTALVISGESRKCFIEATRSSVRTAGGRVSVEASRSIKPLEGSRSWVRRTRSMEIQSIFAWKALPEAGFSKNVVIDAHRCVGSRIRLDRRSAGGPAQPIVIEPSPTFQLHGCTSDRSSKEHSYILPDTLKPTPENRGTAQPP